MPQDAPPPLTVDEWIARGAVSPDVTPGNIDAAVDRIVAQVAALPTRSASSKNSTCFPLTAQSLTDFNALLFLS